MSRCGIVRRLREMSVNYSTALFISAGIISGAPVRRRVSGDSPIVRVQAQALIDDRWDRREVLGNGRQVIVLGWDAAASPRELVSPN